MIPETSRERQDIFMPRSRQSPTQNLLKIAALVAVLGAGCYLKNKPAQNLPPQDTPSVPQETKKGRKRATPVPPGPGGPGTGGITLPKGTDPNLVMGNPSNATSDVSNRNNYLIIRKQYDLSYNNTEGRPNWVSWRLTSDDIGVQERGNFHADPDLPDGFTAVTPTDYRGSGYDRGHMCPSGDRTRSKEDNDPTFYMTNMVPQAADNNQKTWAALESECRSLADAGNVLYIVCGPEGKIGTIGKSATISIPESTWKVIMVMPRKAANPDQVTAKTRVIAVNVPNHNGPDIADGNWRKWRVPVRDIEKATKLNFFSRLPTSLQSTLESRADSE
jgi:endonuclease G